MFMDPLYIITFVLALAIGGASTAYVKGQLNKYSKVPISNGLTGAQAAQQMLAYHGIYGVPVRLGQAGQDFFDPRNNSVTLSPDAYYGTSITATATACHEVGHACQFAENYTPMKIRTAIVPVVNMAENLWMIVLIAGFIFQMMQLVDIAIIMYALVVLFALVTLPVEFNASHRVMNYMGAIALPQVEQKGAFSVLRACALTYVAAALISAIQLLYLLSRRD